MNPTMNLVHEHPIRVDASAVDINGHVNNTEHVRWMQEAAIAHSTALGWPMERYREIGRTWIVRRHEIEYLAPAFAGDDLLAQTWVDSFRQVRSIRKYRILRPRDGAIVAVAQTLWVFVDTSTGRPSPIPAELIADFPLSPGPPTAHPEAADRRHPEANRPAD